MYANRQREDLAAGLFGFPLKKICSENSEWRMPDPGFREGRQAAF